MNSYPNERINLAKGLAFYLALFLLILVAFFPETNLSQMVLGLLKEMSLIPESLVGSDDFSFMRFTLVCVIILALARTIFDSKH